MGITSILQLSSELIGGLTGDLANESFTDDNDMMKSMYKKILGTMMSAMVESPEELLSQYTGMRDCLNEMIDELNGDASIQQ